MASNIEEEAGSSPVTKAEVNVVGILDIYKSRVKVKEDRLSHLRIPFGPDGLPVGLFGSATVGWIRPPQTLYSHAWMLSNLVLAGKDVRGVFELALGVERAS